MKSKVIFTLILGMVLMGATSCATLFSKSRKEVTFKGIPQTDIYDTKGKIGEIGNNGFTTVRLRKKLGSKAVTARKDGYDERVVNVESKINGATWWNLLFGGVPGFLIDAATGKLMTYKKDVVDVTLFQSSGASRRSVDPTVSSEPERVTRDNAGNTGMERAIVRWNVESDPAGARIFWRVISSVPDEVKNTNETYLTTTPYEETRSFNILGLTYENSRDVTIEIKLTKRGYNPQVKRFNVRQALDQQEINTFFELVPEE